MGIANNFEEILLAFSSAKVEFMLAGGFAVNYHGFNRSTSDLDVWVKPVEENKIKLKSALKKLKFEQNQIELLDTLNFNKPFAFSIGAEPIDVDIFNHITGVSYTEAEKNMIPFIYSKKLTVNYISLKDLIVNKMLTGRTQDKLDVEELQKINQFKNKK